MSITNDVFSQALNLSAEKRGELALLLLESLPESERPMEIVPEYEAELFRRLEELDAGQAKVLSLQDVKARLRQRPTVDTSP